MSENYLYELQETKEIVESSGGESDSELCQNCPYTDYGMNKNYSSHPDFGMVMCEGVACDEAVENIEENLVEEYNCRKGELNMSGDAKMKIEVDLNKLEQNVVKMTADRIEQDTINRLTSKIEKRITDKINEKVNSLIEEKVNKITESDIYDVEIEHDGNKVKLFDFMISQLILKAKNKSVEFSDKVDEITSSIQYNLVDDEYLEDEFKVFTTYETDEYGSDTSITININGVEQFSIYEDEPEDMTLGRSLSDALSVPDLIKRAYLAGKSGKIMYEASEVIEEE